jgi:hypothetical protein
MEISPDSFDVKAIGPQADSVKRSAPLWKLGTESRDQAKKVYIGPALSQDSKGRSSPGPVYLPKPLKTGNAFKIGTGPGRSRHVGGLRENDEPAYPDPSGDLIHASYDPQASKFRKPPEINFGTENRDAEKNCPGLEGYTLGKVSPGPQKYDVEGFWLEGPRFSMRPKTKTRQFVSQTPPRVAPGAYPIPSACGTQPDNKKTLPQWSFSKSERFQTSKDRSKPGVTHDALGNAAIKFHRMNSVPSYGFGTSTRDHKKKLTPYYTPADAGPKGKPMAGSISQPNLPSRKELIRFTMP